MRTRITLTAIAAAFALAAPLGVTPAQAGAIDSACRGGQRAGSAALCGCIQQVANQTLSRADQRRAAGFFRDADRAHDARYSKTRADDAFWDRYQRFVSTAQRYCR